MPEALADSVKRKAFSAKLRTIEKPDHNNIDVVATITDDSVDGDNEVVLPQGADLSRYIKAPRIMLCHAYGKPGDYYPIPVGKALWTRREGNAIRQGIRFAKDGEGPLIANLFRDGMLNTFSIGFIAEESSPPTKQEKSARPEWKNVNLVHRKWKLLEVSVVPIPSNENAIGEWVRKGHALPKFLWTPKGTSMDKPEIEDGALVKLDASVGGGFGRVKSLFQGDREAIRALGVDEDASGDAEDCAVVEVLDLEGKMLGTVAVPSATLEVFGKSYHGSPWMGEEAEKSNTYRVMAQGLLDRHAKIMHSRKQGHLYANAASMEGHYVRHKADDDASKGHHTAEQCKAMLETAPGCKGITVSEEHAPDEDAWEMLHPAPPNMNVWQCRTMKKIEPPTESEEEDEEEPAETPPKDKALEEGSGTAGGYLAGEEATAEGNKDDSLTEVEPTYAPKPREVVAWENHEGMHAGAGRVASIHKSGRVPSVINEVTADEKNHHARVNLFKKGDDGDYEETDHHVGVHTKHLKRMPILRVGAKSAPEPKKTEKAPDGEIVLSKIPAFEPVEPIRETVKRALKERDADPLARQKFMDDVYAEIIGAV